MTIVTAVMKTCSSHPAQWGGRDKEGRPIYARYRSGFLSVYVGNPDGTTADALGQKLLIDVQFCDLLDGSLTYEQLKEATVGSFLWPETEAPYEEVKRPLQKVKTNMGEEQTIDCPFCKVTKRTVKDGMVEACTNDRCNSPAYWQPRTLRREDFEGGLDQRCRKAPRLKELR
jgi:hypothetical protein